MVVFDGIVADRTFSASAFGPRRAAILTIRMPDGSVVKVCDAPHLNIGDPIRVECDVQNIVGSTLYRVCNVLSGLEVQPTPKPTVLEW